MPAKKRHLFAAARRVALPHHLVDDAPEGVIRLLVEEVRARV
jgi:hypothetical protein